MKLHFIFSVALILLAYSHQNAWAQESRGRDCPVISVSQVEAGPGLIYKANIQGGDLSVTPKFNWTIADGKILSGQGTAEVSIEVDRSYSFSVLVEVTGYAADCPNKAGYSLIIDRPPPSRKFDDYGDLKFSEERLRLDHFALALDNEPGSQAYIIVYDATNTRKPAARQRGEQAKNYLVKERGLPTTRIVVVNGGHRDKRSVELFIVPLGALPPTATPK
jgi:hypothetical protein